MGLLINGGIRLSSGLNEGNENEECCRDCRCTMYTRGWDICTSTWTDYYICINAGIDFTAIQRLVSGADCLRFAWTDGRFFDTTSTLPGGAILLTESDLEEDPSCSCPDGVAAIRDCLYAIADGIPAIIATWELVDSFEIDASITSSSPFEYTYPIAATNEYYVILGVSGMYKWQPPLPGSPIYTIFLGNNLSGPQPGPTVEVTLMPGETEAQILDYFYGCPNINWNYTTQTDLDTFAGDTSAEWYPYPPIYYDSGTWTVSGSTTWLVFKGTA